jgi:hypothetical protein
MSRFNIWAVHVKEPAMNQHRTHGHYYRHHQSQCDAARLPASSLNLVAFQATLHCLSGCAVGEVLGMVIGTALELSVVATIALAITLAFAFGYAFTMAPLLKSRMPLRQAAKLALAADTASIAIMEVVDNGVMLAWPGAMDAGVSSSVFWMALATSLVIAALAAFPVNRWLIARGHGHAQAHAHHSH